MPRWPGTPVSRFLAKVEKQADGCWKWHGYVYPPSGYGQAQSQVAGRMVGAHRVAHELFKGPIPEGLEIDHLCRNRRCVNPDHLEAVTRHENQARGAGPIGENIRKTHCAHGHPFDEENTGWKRKKGRAPCRYCLTCERLRHREYYAKNRDEMLAKFRAAYRARKERESVLNGVRSLGA